MFQESLRIALARPLAVLGLGLAGLCALATPGHAHPVPLTDAQKIQVADKIVVATVEAKNVRWNAQHTLIVTDYSLRVEDRLKGKAPQKLQITVAGGTLDGETHTSCLSTSLEKGGRYVLFLDDLRQNAFTPFTGAWQGVFQEVRGERGKRFVAEGQRPGVPLKMEGRTLEFATFVDSLRDLIAEVQANPKGLEDLRAVLPAAENPDLPALEYVPFDGKAGRGADIEAGATAEPLAAPDAEVPPPPTEIDLAFAESVEMEGELLPVIRTENKYVSENRPPAPIVFNPLPAGFSWSPSDQNQMAYWNRYAKNLFRVITSTGDWSFGNGRFDMTGFPSNATMISQFGEGWGSTTLGVTWSRVLGGRIIEADVSLNPAFSWTLDTAAARQPTGRTYSFQQTVLHELGHAWGLKHPWETQDVWWDSVMNYAPKEFRVPVLWTDDSTAALRAYPGIAIRDGAVSLWTTSDKAASNNPTYTAHRVTPSSGNFATTTFRIATPMKIENTGTVNLRNPVIEVYASKRRYNFTGAILVKTVRLTTTVPTFFTLRVDLGTFKMPANAPSGTYYIGVFLRDAADAYQSNNSAW